MSTITVIISSKLGTNAWRISEAEDVQLRDWCRTRGQSLPDVIEVINSLEILKSEPDVPEKTDTPDITTTSGQHSSTDVTPESLPEHKQKDSSSSDPFRINGAEKKSKKERR